MNHPFDIKIEKQEEMKRRNFLQGILALAPFMVFFGCNESGSLCVDGKLVTTKKEGEEGADAAEKCGLGSGTDKYGEDGNPTTEAIGEEGGNTTLAEGEEGGNVTTDAIGEEGGSTTKMVGEEGGVTTKALNEEGATTTAVNEDGDPTTLALNEEGGVTTLAVGEEGSGTTKAVGEEGGASNTNLHKRSIEGEALIMAAASQFELIKLELSVNFDSLNKSVKFACKFRNAAGKNVLANFIYQAKDTVGDFDKKVRAELEKLK